MGKAILTLAESGIESGSIMLYVLIGVAIFVTAGYFLLRKKKK
jgi:LPXTG-motif cell wall-anchored protein